MAGVIAGRRGSRGGRRMTWGSAASIPSARAGPESVSRFTHRIMVARSGSTSGSPGEARRPMAPANTTPKNMTITSPTFDESRKRRNFWMLP